MCGQLERDSSPRLTLFAAASRVRTYRSPVAAKGSTVRDRVFGLSSPESFASFCRASSSWKTSQRSLFGGWIGYSERWPRSGILLDGECYPLKTWALHTCAGDFLLSPGETWPTPDAGVFNYAEAPANWDARRRELLKKKVNGNGAGRVLCVEVRRWPTPTAAEANHGHCYQNSRGTIYQTVTGAVGAAPDGPGAAKTDPKKRLNPDWVELLMGFPLGWTTPGPQAEAQSNTITNHRAPESGEAAIEND